MLGDKFTFDPHLCPYYKARFVGSTAAVWGLETNRTGNVMTSSFTKSYKELLHQRKLLQIMKIELFYTVNILLTSLNY